MTNPTGGAATLLETRSAKTLTPMSVTMRVTDRCNYECAHCYQEHDRKPELSLPEIERILREVADAGTLFLVLVGGELFMRRDADQLVQLGHDLGFALRLKTTGHHISEKRADFLATVKPLEVDLSVYGADRHQHEEVTRQVGSWERTLTAARRLIARGVPVILRCPVMQSNAGEIEALRELAASVGAQVSFDAKILARENADMQPVGLRMNEATLRTFYGESMTDYIDQQWTGYDAGTQTRRGQPVNPLTTTPCGSGQRGVTVDPQGLVWPCNLLRVPAGDLRQQSFRDVWFGSPELLELRDVTWAKLSECNVCALRPYCQRCHAMADLEHGDKYGPSLEACRHAVTVRDTLRTRGVIPATEVAMPPTWSRIDPDGQHQARVEVPQAPAPAPDDGRRRPVGLRVLP